MIIENKAVADLRPADYNPRKISADALSGLEASIERFGLVEPIVWNTRTGNVVGGHQRLKVLIKKGAETTDVIVVDLPESEEKALNVVLNNPAITGEFTDDLQIILQDIQLELGDAFGLLKLDALSVPDFEPIENPDVRLDEKQKTVCPECGFEF